MADERMKILVGMSGGVDSATAAALLHSQGHEVTGGAMENHPSATDEDKKGFEQIKMLLHCKEAFEIKHSLAEVDVKQAVLDKIEKLNKDLVDVAIEHLATDAIVKKFIFDDFEIRHKFLLKKLEMKSKELTILAMR